MGKNFGYRPGDLPVTEGLAARLVRLPLYSNIALDDQARIVGQISAFFQSHRRKSGKLAWSAANDEPLARQL